MQRAAAALNHQLASERETIVAVQGVIRAMREMRGFTCAIDRIGADVRFIALNTMVQAEKGGETRTLLAVLARAVREVSVDVERRTQDVGRVMASFSGDLTGFASDPPSSAGEGATARDGALLEDFEVDREELRVGVEALSRDGMALREEVEDLSRKLAANAKETIAIKTLERVLGAMAAEAAAKAGPAACSAARARLASEDKLGQMEHLLAIHRSVTNSVTEVAEAGVGGTCELF